MPTPPCILTIAGSDSGGGAGIQADLKTITVIGGFGMSVITALTAQNGVGVAGIHAPEPGFVGLQLKTVREGFPIAAAKTGMLFSAEIIEAVEAGLQGREFPLVVDPVCVSQSGQRLLREDAVNALRWHILPKADLLTPNRPEAELLADMKIDSEKDIDVAARKLLDMGPKAVLIKGGHFGLRRRIHGLAGSAGRTAHRVEAAWSEDLEQPRHGLHVVRRHCDLFGAWPRDPGCHRARPEVSEPLPAPRVRAGARGGSAEPRFMDCQAGWRIAFPAEKRGRPHAVAPGTPVLVFSFFRRVACPAFSGDSVSGIRAFYRLRERRLAFHANMFYLFLL